jgi:hypothetical protein
VHPAALPGGTDEHRGDRGLEPEVVITDDELHSGEPSGSQSLEERGPERPVFAVADGDAEDLRMVSVISPARSAASRSDRSDSVRATGEISFAYPG